MDAATRNLVRDRGKGFCEYCRLPEHADPYAAFHVEHIISKQHGGNDNGDNLAWACSRCNHRKGPNLSSRDPETGGTVELFNPRRHTFGQTTLRFVAHVSSALQRLAALL